MKQIYQIYNDELEVAFYLYKDDSNVLYVKHNEIINSNLVVDELKYLFTSEYCRLSVFMYSLMNVISTDDDYDCYRARNVVDIVLEKLCGE